ncbi:AH receptor-interacting protein [Ostrinia nubilalis]|uniref:AH receptor-interacting protein n=1 Tax=Ostrinia nubilalis TaxID=29057 RepID=UPI0030823D6A
MENNAPIVKSTIYMGKKYVPITDGCKAYFHFQTWKLGKRRVLLDDSKRIGKKEPMVLVIGHKFKLEVWETIIKMMAIGEVASFQVKKEMVFSYPFVSKTLRELGQETGKVKHSCTMTLQTEGIGYADLDDLMNNPCDLEFVIELLKVESEEDYEKDIWQLNEKERLDFVPTLKERGNKLFKEKNYAEAEECYKKAIGICEQLLLRERKGDEEWKNLNTIKMPILLNYTQCKLLNEDYYAVIEHCNTVLQFDPDNEKALYRRAKAHTGAWNPDQAEEDYRKLKTLNPSMAATIDKELERIKTMRRQKTEQDKNALKNLFASNSSI